MQANHLVRTFVRALSEDVKGIIWYTLEGPGWQNTGLLDGGQNPRPVYIAYQHLIERLRGTTFVQTVSFGTDTEAYIFSDENKFVIVAWAISDKNYTITVPQTNFLEAYDRDGNLLAPTPNGDSNELTLKFNPIFIEYQK
jgi:hypothetical protein